MKRTIALAAIATVAAAGAAEAQTREQIRVVGSSTVFPYSTLVAERYSQNTGNPAPVVESTGTGGGMQIFCQGIGPQHPDLTGASRAMKQSEFDLCVSNGVTDITEVLVGYDGLSMAVAREGETFDITEAELFAALAAEVEVDGEIVDNPYTRWSEINPDLPDLEIQVFGPPPTSGTRDAWVELVMEEGCEAYPAIEALEGDRKDEVCQRMREDGYFIEAGENDNLIVQRLTADSGAYGIFGYSFLYENQDALEPVIIEGIEPNEDTIADGSYPVARPLYFYIKNAHRGVIPGLEEFVAEYVSDDAMGPGGYLTDIGLVALSEERRAEVQSAALEGTDMERPE